MERLKKRREFVRLQKGRRAHTGFFTVQALPREDGSPRTAADDIGASRIGFTISKRVSPLAVKRNRIRRRLKEAARLASAPDGMDFVIVARIEALNAPFLRLASELEGALRKAAGRYRDASGAVGRGFDPKKAT